jgi:hypothetical protein
MIEELPRAIQNPIVLAALKALDEQHRARGDRNEGQGRCTIEVHYQPDGKPAFVIIDTTLPVPLVEDSNRRAQRAKIFLDEQFQTV